MPNRINKGPDIYDPQSLNVEYSRREREEMTSYVSGRRRGGSRKLSLRILLLDLLLLCIIGGIIYPFIVNSNRKGELQGLGCELSLRSDDETLYISLLLINPDGGDPAAPVDVLFLINGQTARELTDLSPGPGEERTIRFKMKREKEKIDVRVRISKDGESLSLNAAVGAL